jgi:DNA-binding transcriptional MocR family regulator
MNATISSPTLNQFVIGQFLKSGGYDRHLRRLRAALKNQASNMALSVARHFPQGTRITAPDGGLTLWVELPSKVDGLDVFKAALGAGIAVLPGSMCSGSNRYRHFIRLSCGLPWSDAVERGIETLGVMVGRLGEGRKGA